MCSFMPGQLLSGRSISSASRIIQRPLMTVEMLLPTACASPRGTESDQGHLSCREATGNETGNGSRKRSGAKKNESEDSCKGDWIYRGLCFLRITNAIVYHDKKKSPTFSYCTLNNEAVLTSNKRNCRKCTVAGKRRFTHCANVYEGNLTLQMSAVQGDNNLAIALCHLDGS